LIILVLKTDIQDTWNRRRKVTGPRCKENHLDYDLALSEGAEVRMGKRGFSAPSPCGGSEMNKFSVALFGALYVRY